ncbi:MAG: alpha/beta hydrolase [Bacteroidota bacterium]
MIKWLILVFCGFKCFNLTAQTKTTIYCVQGQGSDIRLFDSLRLDTNYRLQFIQYSTPPKNATMESFARELIQQIDTTQPFILAGVSLGGMLCVEMQEMVHPQKTIIISSASSRKELPFRYRFQRAIPLYAIVPGRIMRGGAKMLQPIVEPDRKHNKETFKKMLGAKTPAYMKRTVRMIIRWERKTAPEGIIQIHGTNDHTLPYRKLKKVDYPVKNGSHMMTLTQAEAVSEALNKALKDV